MTMTYEERRAARAASVAQMVSERSRDFQRDVRAMSLPTELVPVHTFLTANAAGNDFYTSLLSQLEQRGSLSEKQLACVERAMNKPKATQLDASAIQAMFHRAHGNGLRTPRMVFGDLTISRAPDHGANAGALYVKRNGEYQGKIVADGRYFPVREAAKETADELLVICANPFEAITQKGLETGVCSCCGRLLTNPESIELGIGPICRSKWFA